MSVNNNTLPLLYMKGKTVRVFLIVNNSEEHKTENETIGDLSTFTHPDTVLFNCDSINITPQVGIYC